MAAVALKRVAICRNNNLRMPLVRTHYIHLVINVLAVASSLLTPLHSITIALPLLFCHTLAIRPCHTNVCSFENIFFSPQCLGLSFSLNWHYTMTIWSEVQTKEHRNRRLPWLAGSILKTKPIKFPYWHITLEQKDMSMKTFTFDMTRSTPNTILHFLLHFYLMLYFKGWSPERVQPQHLLHKILI